MKTTLAEGEKLKHFTIKKLLGAGGMGEVYLANDESLSRDVAIKILKVPEGDDEISTDAIRRFLSEAKVLAQLSTETITTIHYISKAEERFPFIVMEFLEGDNLKDYSKKNNLTIGFLLKALMQLAQGMQLVHDKGIIHRDIKPANLFITNQNKFKILDFGIAKWKDDTVGIETKTNQFVGSLMYAAPEVFQSKDFDHRVDIYSLGLSIVSLIVGRPPFEGATTYQVLNQIQYEDIRLGDELAALVPEDLLIFLYKMIEKDPDDRPANMLEVYNRASEIFQSNQSSLDISISRMIETGEIEIHLQNTYDLKKTVRSNEKTAVTQIKSNQG